MSILANKQRRLQELHAKRADLERRLERQKGAAEAVGNLGRMDRYIPARKALRELADELHQVKAEIARLETKTIVAGPPSHTFSGRYPR